MSNCAECGRKLKSRHPKQRFCSPINGRRLCKDRHHNRRRYQIGDISEARRKFLESDEGHAHPFAQESFKP